jgi:hypothetical protein
MRWGRWVAPAVLAGVVLVVSADSASAHLDSTNGCSGLGVLLSSRRAIDAAGIGDEVVKIPREDSIEWQASVAAPPGAYSGSISVDLPPPFGEAQIDSWEGESQATANAGVKEYDFPSMVPAGVEFKVLGSHTDENGSCTGYVNLEIDGGPFDSPLAPISLAGTALTGAGIVATVRPMFRRAS